MFKTALKLAVIAAVSNLAYAADYYVVVPFKNKAISSGGSTAPTMPQISVTLASYGLPAGTLGEPYPGFDLNTLLSVQGDQNFESSKVTWSVVSGALPTGLALTATGQLSGIPLSSGSYVFRLKAAYLTASGSQDYLIDVAIPVSVNLAAQDLPSGMVGSPYSYNFNDLLAITGSSQNQEVLLWSIADGALPPGIQLDEQSGTLTGTPISAATYSFTVKVQYGSKNDLQVYSIPVTLTTTSFLAHMNSLSETPAVGRYDALSTAITLDTANFITGGASFYNNTSNARVKMLGDATTTFGTGDFTIEFWARRTRRDADYSAYMFSMAGVAQIWIDDLTSSNTNNKLYFSTGKGSISAPSYMAMSTWYHLALVRKNGVISAFVNGTKVASLADASNYAQQDIHLFSKATMQSAPNNYRSFYGNIDEVRVSKTARYDADFTPSATELQP